MNDTASLGAPSYGGLERRVLLWLSLGYPPLYVLGYLSKFVAGATAIWPAHALTFAACLLLRVRLWPLIALGVLAFEVLSRPLLHWWMVQSRPALALSCGYACANILAAAGPAALARMMRLFRSQDRFALVISPLWIVALFAGSLPGALLGALTRASTAGMDIVPADTGLWVLAAVLSIVTFGPMVFGLILGFGDAVPTPARAWERWLVGFIILALFTGFALTPRATLDPLPEPMLLAAPLAWLALRCSRRATNVGVVLVATGVVLFAGHGIGIYRGLTSADTWQPLVISLDLFLVIGCGGALLVNLMMLKQRALLDELAQEHLALRDYAHALSVAEETARRRTAADLHDGIGQILAGQGMTLAAMRSHAIGTPLRELLDEASEASREAQEGLRATIQDLSPPGLDHASLDETLGWLADFFESRFGFRVAWRVTGTADLSRESLRLIYRCVRELLMNARKHSQRRSAEVEVDLSPTAVEIMVVDEGVGFDVRAVESRSGFGLTQLRERVRAAGGTLDFDAVIGEGTRVTVRLPAPTLVLG